MVSASERDVSIVWAVTMSGSAVCHEADCRGLAHHGGKRPGEAGQQRQQDNRYGDHPEHDRRTRGAPSGAGDPWHGSSRASAPSSSPQALLQYPQPGSRRRTTAPSPASTPVGRTIAQVRACAAMTHRVARRCSRRGTVRNSGKRTVRPTASSLARIFRPFPLAALGDLWPYHRATVLGTTSTRDRQPRREGKNMPIPIGPDLYGTSDPRPQPTEVKSSPVCLSTTGHPVERHRQPAGRVLAPSCPPRAVPQVRGLTERRPVRNIHSPYRAFTRRSYRSTTVGDSRDAERQERRDCTMRTIDDIGLSSPPAAAGWRSRRRTTSALVSAVGATLCALVLALTVGVAASAAATR